MELKVIEIFLLSLRLLYLLVKQILSSYYVPGTLFRCEIQREEDRFFK